jgi:DNA repair ATPase RecN
VQVACYAQHHVRVAKDVCDQEQQRQGKKQAGEGKGRVVTRFEHLATWQQRAEEVADMMSECNHHILMPDTCIVLLWPPGSSGQA